MTFSLVLVAALLSAKSGALQSTRGRSLPPLMSNVSAPTDPASTIRVPIPPVSFLDQEAGSGVLYDKIEEYRKMSIQTQGGEFHRGLSITFVVVAGLLTAYLCYSVHGGGKPGRTERLFTALDALMLVWFTILFTAAFVCCVSVWRGQGLVYGPSTNNVLTRPSENQHKLKYDEHFIPAIIVASLMLIPIFGTLYARRWRPRAVERPERAGVAQAAGGKKKRNYALDHCKYYLMYGIIMIHFTLDNQYEGAQAFNNAIDAFGDTHWINMFIMLSGYNAALRMKDMLPRRMDRTLKMGLIYFWMQALYLLHFYFVFVPMTKGMTRTRDLAHLRIGDHTIIHYRPKNDNLTAWDWYRNMWSLSDMALWYMRSLCMWLLLIPYWLQLRFPIIAALFFTFAAMYEPEAQFGPLIGDMNWVYFVIGAAAKHRSWDKKLFKLLAHPFARIASLISFLLFNAYGLVMPFAFHKEWKVMLNRGGNLIDKAHDLQWWYTIGRTLNIAVSVVIICGWIAIMPRSPSYFTRASSFTLVAYLIHPPILRMIVATGFYNDKKGFPTRITSFKYVLCLIVFPIAFSLLLMHPPVARVLMRIVNPPMGWMFRPKSKVGKKAPQTEAADASAKPWLRSDIEAKKSERAPLVARE